MARFPAEDTTEPLLRSRTYEDAEMDITPMIDMTFLLLIFFLVCSKIDTSGVVKLPPARYGLPVAQARSVIITVGADDKGGALVYKGDGLDPSRLIAATGHEAQEAEVAAYVESELARGNKRDIVIKADGPLKRREVARIEKAATRSEAAQQLYVGVTEVSK